MIMLSVINYVSLVEQEVAIITWIILVLKFLTTWVNFCFYYVGDKSLYYNPATELHIMYF